MSCTHPSSCSGVGQLAEDEQVGHLEEGALLGELLDRIAPVAQDPGVAVEEGDRAAARGRVHEGRVVGHEAEVSVIDLDLPEVGRPDRAVRDRQLVAVPVRLSVIVSVSAPESPAASVVAVGC